MDIEKAKPDSDLKKQPPAAFKFQAVETDVGIYAMAYAIASLALSVMFSGKTATSGFAIFPLKSDDTASNNSSTAFLKMPQDVYLGNDIKKALDVQYFTITFGWLTFIASQLFSKRGTYLVYFLSNLACCVNFYNSLIFALNASTNPSDERFVNALIYAFVFGFFAFCGILYLLSQQRHYFCELKDGKNDVRNNLPLPTSFISSLFGLHYLLTFASIAYMSTLKRTQIEILPLPNNNNSTNETASFQLYLCPHRYEQPNAESHKAFWLFLLVLFLPAFTVDVTFKLVHFLMARKMTPIGYKKAANFLVAAMWLATSLVLADFTGKLLSLDQTIARKWPIRVCGYVEIGTPFLLGIVNLCLSIVYNCDPRSKNTGVLEKENPNEPSKDFVKNVSND